MKGKKAKRKIKSIAHLHWGYPPIIGGVETHLTILLPALRETGYEVSLLTCTGPGAKIREQCRGVRILRTPLMDLNWLYKRGLNGLEAEIKTVFGHFLDQSRADVIHVHNMNYFSPIHIRTLESLARVRRVPLILTAHNVWDDNLFLDLTRNIKWSHIIAVSHFIKRELIGCGIDDRKITVVHHGIDEKIYSAHGKTARIYEKYPVLKNRSVIFHPARMGLAKGCDVSIKALNIIRERVPNTVLVLAGTKNIIDWGGTQQKDIAYMVDLVDFFKLRNNILIDAFPLKLMPELYRVADVCLYPSSVSEPFGLTMLEALATERPMVVTEMGGMPEIIKDGINGFVVPVRDFEALASRTVQLLQNPRLRDRLGYTGRHMVENHYTREMMTRNTLEVYRRTC